MSARQTDTHSQETPSGPGAFAKSARAAHLTGGERTKLLDLCDDVARLDESSWIDGSLGVAGAFSGFEWLLSRWLPRVHRDRSLPVLDREAMEDAAPKVFAWDYKTFDRLSVRYGGLFRGSVIVNYLLGAAAVAMTVAEVLPRLLASSADARGTPELAPWATFLELACIGCIAAIYCYGRTPRAGPVQQETRSRRRGFFRRVAHRWRERWLEYRLLAERFRYIELLLAISPSAASSPPFETPGDESRHWYDEYFAWRTEGAQASPMSASDYRTQALALMVEQVEHHTANSARRGSIAERLEQLAVGLFFLSLGLSFIALLVEVLMSHWSSCGRLVWLNETYGPWLFLGAVLAPTLSAAIHGILATTEYTKLAEASRETAARIRPLALAVKAFHPGDAPAVPETLEPICQLVTAFADAAINEASGWRATLHDKNVPLA